MNLLYCRESKKIVDHKKVFLFLQIYSFLKAFNGWEWSITHPSKYNSYPGYQEQKKTAFQKKRHTAGKHVKWTKHGLRDKYFY